MNITEGVHKGPANVLQTVTQWRNGKLSTAPENNFLGFEVAWHSNDKINLGHES